MKTLIRSLQIADMPELPQFSGANANTPYLADDAMKLHRKLCSSIEDAVQRSGLKDGMTVSFHHAFREGDKVLNQVMATLARMGFRNLTLASSSLLNCHDAVLEHIQSGVVGRIYTSGLRGK